MPWPIAALPGFVQLDTATDGWMPVFVEKALGDARRSADAPAWKSVGLYRAGAEADACRLAQSWDWCGPALSVDAECASGLVALIMARTN